ncbi:MAG: PAS domain S-box protein [Methanobacteriota archaeon]
MATGKNSDGFFGMSDYLNRISELERLVEEKTAELEMANMLLKNEMEVRSSFEADLQESEEKFRTIAEITPLGMLLVNQENTIIYMNPQVTRSLGYTQEEIPDIQTALTVLFPDSTDQEIARSRWKERAWFLGKRSQESEPVVFLMFAKDGSRRTLELFFTPYGQIMLVLLHDITDRKKAEDALHEADRRYREMIEKIPLIAVILNREGKVVFGNEYFLTVTGWKSDEILGIDWFSTFTLPEDNVQNLFLQYLQNENVPTQNEYTILTKKKDNHSILWTNLVLKDLEGSTTGVVSLGTDITERKKREQAILLANKKLNILSSISRHDIANGLTELYLNLELAQDNAQDLFAQDLIGKAIEAIRMIRHQIEFSRFYQDIGVHAPEWYVLDTIIRYAVSDIPLASLTITIETDHISIYADPLIQKVFINLIDNTIRHGENVTRISFTLFFEGSDLIIRYGDNGVGVRADEKEKIFERGFGKHTGMGLFLIREILTITGIDIREVGEYGNGAEFILIVPKGKWRRDETDLPILEKR